MNRDHVYQMRGKRRVTGFRLRAVDPEACQRLLQPGELEFEEACWEMRFHHDAFEAKVRAHQAARDELAASNKTLPEKTPEPLCTGYEVVCPDGRVRDYPYHNLGDAESTARLATKRQCRLYPEPSPLELSQPPCPEGEHVVRVVVFQEPQEAVIGQA